MVGEYDVVIIGYDNLTTPDEGAIIHGHREIKSGTAQARLLPRPSRSR